jgi:hypothetical protein
MKAHDSIISILFPSISKIAMNRASLEEWLKTIFAEGRAIRILEYPEVCRQVYHNLKDRKPSS